MTHRFALLQPEWTPRPSSPRAKPGCRGVATRPSLRSVSPMSTSATHPSTLHRPDVRHQPGWRRWRAGRISGRRRGAATQTLASVHLPFPTDAARRTDGAAGSGRQRNRPRSAGRQSRWRDCMPPCVAELLEQASCRRARCAPSACTARPSATAPNSASRARPTIRPCWPNWPASTSSPTSAAATSPPAARARRWCRPFTRRVFGKPARRASWSTSAASATSACCDGASAAAVTGFDTGPGNVLMDGWIMRHRAAALRRGRRLGRQRQAVAGAAAALARRTLLLPCRRRRAPAATCSTWPGWTTSWQPCRPADAADVQATLAALTAGTIADAIATHAASANAVYVCGGGAYNGHLLRQLAAALATHGHPSTVRTDRCAGHGAEPGRSAGLRLAGLPLRQPPARQSAGGDRGPRPADSGRAVSGTLSQRHRAPLIWIAHFPACRCRAGG